MPTTVCSSHTLGSTARHWSFLLASCDSNASSKGKFKENSQDIAGTHHSESTIDFLNQCVGGCTGGGSDGAAETIPQKAEESWIRCANQLSATAPPSTEIVPWLSQRWSAILSGLWREEDEPQATSEKDPREHAFTGPHLNKFCDFPCFFTGKAGLHVFFPLDTQWNAVDKLVKTRLLYDAETTARLNASMIPALILDEVFRCRAYNIPLAATLRPLGKGATENLVLVVHPALRRMLVGHVMGMLTLLINGYINGGTYAENTIATFSKTRNLEDLQEGIIDPLKELNREKKRREAKCVTTTTLPSRYICLGDIVEEESLEKGVDNRCFAEFYDCSYEARGTMSHLEHSEGTVLEPESSVAVECEMRVKPSLGCQLAMEVLEGVEETYEHGVFMKASAKMGREVEENMSRHPVYAPYFELLRMITFCAGLADAMCDAGAYPWREKVWRCSSTPLASLPVVVPPPPVRRGPVISLEVSFDDIARTLYEDGKQGIVNKMIRDEAGGISMEERTKCLLDASRKTAVKAIKAEEPSSGAAVETLDDGTLQVPKLASTFRQFLQRVVCLAIISKAMGMMKGLCNIFANLDTPVVDPKEIDDKFVESYEEFNRFVAYSRDVFLRKWLQAAEAEVNRQRDEAKKNVEKHMKPRSEIEATTRNEVEEKIHEQITNSLQQLKEKLWREAEANHRVRRLKLTEQRRKDVETTISREVQRAKGAMEKDARMKKEKIVRDNVNKRMESMRAAVMEAKNDVERNAREALQKIKDAAKDLQQEITNAQSNMLRDPLGHYLKMNSGFTCVLLKTRIKLGFSDVPKPEDVNWRISVSCTLRKNFVHIEQNSALAKRHKDHCNNDAYDEGGSRVNDKEKPYFHCYVPLQHFGGDENSLQSYLLQNGPEEDQFMIRRCADAGMGGKGDKRDTKREVLDTFGLQSAHYIGCVPLLSSRRLVSVPPQTVNALGADGVTPLHVACLSENLDVVKLLISQGADPNAKWILGLNPLLIASLVNCTEIALFLLHTGRVDCNATAMDGSSALHWAARHNNAALIGKLLECGAMRNQQRLADNATPLHVAARCGSLSCTKLLLNGVPGSVMSFKTTEERTPLHEACYRHHTECAICILQSLPADKRVMALSTEDKMNLSPFMLALFVGHWRLALTLCETAGVRQLNNLTDGLSKERRAKVEHAVRKVPLLSAFLKANSGTEVKETVPEATTPFGFAREKIVESSSTPEGREQLIRSCILMRDAGCLKRLALYGSLSTAEVRRLLMAVVKFGLLDWPPTLSNCGIDVCIASVDGKGNSLLSLAAGCEDAALFRVVWTEFARFVPKERYYHHLVIALRSLTLKSTDMWEAMAEILQGIEDNPKEGAADPLLESPTTTAAQWTFARHFRLQPSTQGIIKGAGTCRPTIIQSLLGEGLGRQEDVQLQMLKEALRCHRKDNALTILMNSWPNFDVRPSSMTNKLLAATVQELVVKEKMSSFKKILEEQEEVLQCPLRLQEVSASAGKRFFDHLVDRQFYAMENHFFGVYAWLLSNSTEKFKCPWDPNIEDERGTNGYVCSCRSVCVSPSNVKKIAESIGVSVDDLLLHPSFSTSLRMCASPVLVAQKILEVHCTSTAVAACLSSLVDLPECTFAMWNSLLDSVPCIAEKLQSILHIVVGAQDQVTLLMKILPLPEASKIVDVALDSPLIGEALKMRDRYGRSAAHHLMSHTFSKRHRVCPPLKESIAFILCERLRRVISIYPPLLHQQDRDGYSLFLLATKLNNTVALSFLGTQAPASVHNRLVTNEGLRALHTAVNMDAHDAVRMLICDFGIDPNDRASSASVSNVTPLHLAAKKSNTQVFETLISLGADAMAKDSRGETPLHWAMRYGNNSLYQALQALPGFWLLSLQGELILPLAENKSLYSRFKKQLLSVTHPNRAMRSYRRRTPFLEAVKGGDVSTVHSFAKMGADLVSFDSEKCNSLHFASLRGNTAILVHILQYTAAFYPETEVKKLLLQCTASGDSPLHYAAQSGSLGCTEILLSFPCVRENSVLKQNNKGLTPANVAILSGHSEIALLIQETSTEQGSPTALHSGHEEILKKFWSSPSAELKKRVREKVEDLQMVELSQCMGRRAAFQESEQRWEIARAKVISAVSSVLPEKEQTFFLSHSAFSCGVVKVLLMKCVAGEDENTLRAVVKWCRSSGLPAHACHFCLSRVMIWEPLESWNTVMSLFSSTGEVWPAEDGDYPAQEHVFWDWLQIIFNKRIDVAFDQRIFSALQTFISALKGPLVNCLPPPQRSLFNHEELAFNDSLYANITNINSILEKSKNEDELRLFVQNLDVIWCRDFFLSIEESAIVTKDTMNWMSLLHAVAHRFGPRIMRSLKFLASFEEPINSEAYSFILSVINYDAAVESEDSALMAWTSAASLAIAAVGLGSVHTVYQTLIENFKSTTSMETVTNLFFPLMTSVAQSMMELEPQVLLSQCIEGTYRSELSVKQYAAAVSDAMRSTIMNSRAALLGDDRPIDELIEAFGGRSDGSLSSLGLPGSGSSNTMPLSPQELAGLRRVITQVESNGHNGSFSLSQLKEEGAVAGGRMRAKPNLDDLASIISSVREAVYRTNRKRPFRIQCMCVAAFFIPLCMAESDEERKKFRGRLAQVATGEGKSIIVAMTAIVFGLLGETVDVITSSGALASRDVEEYGELYRLFGLRVSHISVETPTKFHFNAEVVYGTNTDFEFVLLREGCFQELIAMFDQSGSNSWVKRPRGVAIVDEADNLFLDAAQNSARIAYSTGKCFSWVYGPIFDLVSQDIVSPSAVRATLSSMQNGYYAEMTKLLTDAQLEGWIRAARVAISQHRRDKEYIVRQQRIVIVDLDTGRLQESSRWGHGIHEMIEVKEGVPVHPESGVIGSVSHPSFFDEYSRVIGITGTAGEREEREEILSIYGIDTFDVPFHRPCLRRQLPAQLFKTKLEKQKAMVRSALEYRMHTSVLILLPTIIESNEVVQLINSSQRGASCFVLNETQRENEEFVLLKVSQPGTILVATNTAGRGTDIRPSKQTLEAGGLHVIYGAFPPNLRVESQGIGRCARQGQPGSCQIFLSLDEDFVRQITGGGLISVSEKCVQQLYAARTRCVQLESMRRERVTAQERVHFSCFHHFTQDQEWLKNSVLTMNNAETVAAIRMHISSTHCITQVSVGEYMQRLCECFRILWVNYFTSATDRKEIGDVVIERQVVRDQASAIEALKLKGHTLYKNFLTANKWPLSKFIVQTDIAKALSDVMRSHAVLISSMDIHLVETNNNSKRRTSLITVPPKYAGNPLEAPQ